MRPSEDQVLTEGMLCPKKEIKPSTLHHQRFKTSGQHVNEFWESDGQLGLSNYGKKEATLDDVLFVIY